MPSKQETQVSGGRRNGSPKNVTKLRKADSLKRLKDRVQAATDELVRLKSENSNLASSIRELRLQLDEQDDRPSVSFDSDPEEIRRKVRGFINAIDQYLGDEE